jgi:hypothetical protein
MIAVCAELRVAQSAIFERVIPDFLTGQGRRLIIMRYRRCGVSAFSTCSANLAACYQNRRRHLRPPTASLRLGARFDLLPASAARVGRFEPVVATLLHEMPRRRASAIRAVRIVDRRGANPTADHRPKPPPPNQGILIAPFCGNFETSAPGEEAVRARCVSPRASLRSRPALNAN